MRTILAIILMIYSTQVSAENKFYKAGDVFLCQPRVNVQAHDACFKKGTSTNAFCFDPVTGNGSADVEKKTIVENVEPLEKFVVKLIERDFLGKPRLLLEASDFAVFWVDYPIDDDEASYMYGNNGSEAFCMETDWYSATFGYARLGGNVEMIYAYCEKF